MWHSIESTLGSKYRDLKLDHSDLLLFASIWGLTPDSGEFMPAADLDGDALIGDGDLVRLSDTWFER